MNLPNLIAPESGSTARCHPHAVDLCGTSLSLEPTLLHITTGLGCLGSQCGLRGLLRRWCVKHANGDISNPNILRGLLVLLQESQLGRLLRRH